MRPVSPPQRSGQASENPHEPRLVLYSRSSCHLCDEMILALRLQLGSDFPVAIVDVDSDPVLELRYGDRVPLLMDGELELCGYRYDPSKLAPYASQVR
ncbi:MAG TPA: glutaredoxin family protein [Burkholderiales bacterium]